MKEEESWSASDQERYQKWLSKPYKMSNFKKVLDASLVEGLSDFYKKSWPSLCDLTIQCSDGNAVPACRLILAIHSEYFAAYFRQEENTSSMYLFESLLVNLHNFKIKSG